MAPTRPLESPDALSQLQARVRGDARRLAAIVAVPGEAPGAVSTLQKRLDAYRLERVTLGSEPGITLEGLITIPNEGGPHPAVLWMDAAPHEETAESAELVRLAESGHVVLAFHPRGVLGERG